MTRAATLLATPDPDELHDELRRQSDVLDHEALIRLVASALAYGMGLIYLPLAFVATVAFINLAAEVVSFRLFRDIGAMVRDPWRRALAGATVFVIEVCFVLPAGAMWHLDNPYAKALAVGLASAAMMHLATVRAIHLPHGLAGGTALSLVVLGSNAAYWVPQGAWLELAASTLCGIVGLGYFASATVSNHRLHRDSAAQRRSAQQADAAKDRFLAQMSHELRTPLNGILGMADAELRNATDPASKARLATLVESAQGLNAILNDILDLSALQNGRVAIRPRPAVPAAEVEAAVALFRPAAGAAGLQMTVEIDPALGEPALIDAQRLRQCLSNLLSNAIRHGTTATRIGVVAARLGDTEDRPLLAVEVEDDGPGVPTSAQAGLFAVLGTGPSDPPEAPAAFARSRGHGLGLSIARGLARQMGGDVRLLPPHAGGTGARFLLTVAMPPAGEARDTAAEPDATAQSLRGMRVLVVDDVPTNRLVALTYLRHLGATACEAGSGAEALRRLAVERVDVVLLDMNMPDLDGLQTLQRLRALPHPFGGVAVVALTADALQDHRAHFLAQGLDGYLAKPVTPGRIAEELLAVVGERLKESA